MLNRFIRIFLWVGTLLCTAPGNAQDQKIRILLAGDSTVQDVDHNVNPDWGWGQVLPRYFDDRIEIINLAKGGRSSRTFIEEGRWQTLLDQTRAGDFVFIQFGHNDIAENKPERYTPPVDYRTNLERFVRQVREKGATPVLITPVTRRNFDHTGNVDYKHGVYPAIVRDVAEENSVVLFDLKTKSRRVVKEHGEEASKKIYIHLKPGEHPTRPDGANDNTHFSEYGAILMAEIIVGEIKNQNLIPLSGHLK